MEGGENRFESETSEVVKTGSHYKLNARVS